MISLNRQTSLGPARLKDESGPAYRAFGVYRDLGTARSLDKAWRRFLADQGKDPALARRPGHWADWSQKFSWVERAQAHDDLIDEEKRNADAARRQELHEERSRFAVEEQQQKQNLVRKFDARLEKEFTASRAEVTQVKSVDGTKTTTKLRPANLLGMATVTRERNKTARQAIEGIDSKNLDSQERQVERIVWAPARPIASLVPHPPDSDLDEAPFQEDEAA